MLSAEQRSMMSVQLAVCQRIRIRIMILMIHASGSLPAQDTYGTMTDSEFWTRSVEPPSSVVTPPTKKMRIYSLAIGD